MYTESNDNHSHDIDISLFYVNYQQRQALDYDV